MTSWSPGPADPALSPGEVHVWRGRAQDRSMPALILARYLRVDPATLVFQRGPWGKPFLDGIEFNLSHSGGLALVAVSLDRAVGVDIERIGRVTESTAIAERYFSEEERRAVAQGPPGRFFEIWTRKEAQLKAIGRGLSALEDAPEHGWFVQSLDAGEGYAAALAVAGEPSRVETWDFSP